MDKQRRGVNCLIELLSLAILIGWGIVLLPGWMRSSPPELEPLTGADWQTLTRWVVGLVAVAIVVALARWVARGWRRK